MANAIVLCSGGLDSAVAAFYARKKMKYTHLVVLFLRYGQNAVKQEEVCSRKIARSLNADFFAIDLPWLGKISETVVTKRINKRVTKKELENQELSLLPWWVPCRNAVFLMVATAYAESLRLKTKRKFDIVTGFQSEGRLPMKDTTPRFLRKMQSLLKEATFHGDYSIKAPLIRYDKTEIVKLGSVLNVPFHDTYSCYQGRSNDNKEMVHCGSCLNCQLRKQAFYWVNRKDPTVYARH